MDMGAFLQDQATTAKHILGDTRGVLGVVGTGVRGSVRATVLVAVLVRLRLSVVAVLLVLVLATGGEGGGGVLGVVGAGERVLVLPSVRPGVAVTVLVLGRLGVVLVVLVLVLVAGDDNGSGGVLGVVGTGVRVLVLPRVRPGVALTVLVLGRLAVVPVVLVLVLVASDDNGSGVLGEVGTGVRVLVLARVRPGVLVVAVGLVLPGVLTLESMSGVQRLVLRAEVKKRSKLDRDRTHCFELTRGRASGESSDVGGEESKGDDVEEHGEDGWWREGSRGRARRRSGNRLLYSRRMTDPAAYRAIWFRTLALAEYSVVRTSNVRSCEGWRVRYACCEKSSLQ